MIHHQVVGNGDPQLVLTMYMPKVYIDSNATEEKYTLNAFGVFTELESFKAMSYNKSQNVVMHRLAFQNDYSLIDSNKRYSPFYYLIPVDIQTDKGTSLGTTRTMYRNTAEMLYGRSGLLINFMNALADKLSADPEIQANAPDFHLFSFAYHYTKEIPKVSPEKLRCNDNVAMMICLNADNALRRCRSIQSINIPLE
jgi:hypothetical protein